MEEQKDFKEESLNDKMPREKKKKTKRKTNKKPIIKVSQSYKKRR